VASIHGCCDGVDDVPVFNCGLGVVSIPFILELDGIVTQFIHKDPGNAGEIVDDIHGFRYIEVSEFFTGLMEENLDALKREVLDLIVRGMTIVEKRLEAMTLIVRKVR
jgi:hypothetical protein